MTSKNAKRPRSNAPLGARQDVRISVVRLPHAVGLALPAYQSADAAGVDLVAALGENATHLLAPGDRALIPTGLTIAMPPGFEAQVRPRSGLALKHGVTVLNSPGTIDADYRGEISVILVNHGSEAFAIQRGERIAQLVFAPVSRGTLVEVGKLAATDRGAGGFGSTGTASKAVPKPTQKSKSVASQTGAEKSRSKKRPTRKTNAT